jgi:serine/threonine-protein kinase
VNLVSIEGKYEILGKLREGGMGAVYKVRHRLLDEIRVVKVIRPHLNASPELSDRFVREARLAIQLRHPNIAQLHDFSVDPDGSAFIVLEFIDGATLDDLLKATGPPPLGLGLDIAQQSLRALGYLHRKGFVHRDIAPDNLMLTRDVDGRPLVKLIDLGIAKLLTAGGGGLTVTGMFLGKPRYASPEQFGSEGEAGTDARSDLYSLAVVLYELLTGTHPIPGRDPSSFMAGHMFRPPVGFAESDPQGRLPPDLREILLRALAKRPEERFQSAAELSERLAALQARIPVAPVDLDGMLHLASQGSPAEGVGPPGSTQDRLDHRFAKEATPVNLEATQVLKPATLSPAPPSAPPRRAAADLDETGHLIQPQEEPVVPAGPAPRPFPPVLSPSAPPSAAFQRPPREQRRTALWVVLGAGLVAVVLAAGLAGWFLRSGLPSRGPSEPETSPPPAAAETPASPAASTASVEVPAAEPAAPVSSPVLQPVLPEAPQPRPAEPPEQQEARPASPRPVPTAPPAASAASAAPAARERTPPPRPAAKDRKTVEAQVDHSAGERKGRKSEITIEKGDPASAGSEIEDARIISSPAAVYPESEIASGTYAMVSVSVLVDEKGAVVEAKIKGAYVDGGAGAEFRKAALTAARQARFAPATRNGQPMKMWGELTYEFGTKKP